MRINRSKINPAGSRIPTIDFLRGVVIIIMALDHVRMYFGQGSWYASPTHLATTTPLLFFTRWITHFCAPVFLFLAGTSAYLYGLKRENIQQTAWYLLRRGLWLVVVEVVLVTFGWTFDVTYSFLILQVIWAIGISMMTLAGLVFLPKQIIFMIGMALVFGHNLLDPITVQGTSFTDYIWYTLHQPRLVILNNRLVSIFYPVLPWLGLMALGYVGGSLYRRDFPLAKRTVWLMGLGFAATILFFIMRQSNAYGEPASWQTQDTAIFTLISFLNTTKYPPSLQFILMTLGPALIFLAFTEYAGIKSSNPFVIFGRVPFFFYILHIYFIHAFALLVLEWAGWDWRTYILSAEAYLSGRLNSFGFGLAVVYAIWLIVVIVLYPLCRWYQKVRENHPEWGWLSYL